MADPLDATLYDDALAPSEPRAYRRPPVVPPPPPPQVPDSPPGKIPPEVSPSAPKPEERQPSLAEQQLQLTVERDRAAIRREEQAARREDEMLQDWRESTARQRREEEEVARVRREGAQEELAILREEHQARRDRPHYLTPAPPPQAQYTLPPGLFGSQGAPGNRMADAMSVFGGLSPRGLMGANIAQIKALTGMLEGWHEGQREKFELARTQWREQNDYIKEVNATLRERYNDVLEDSKLSLEEKKAELELRMMPMQDVIAMETARRGDLKSLSELMDHRDAQLDKADRAQEQLTRTLAEWEKAHGGGGATDPDAPVSDEDRIAAEAVLAGKPLPASRSAAQVDRLKHALAVIGRERGWSPQRIAEEQARAATQLAGERSYETRSGTIAANAENAANEVKQLLPQALEASRRLPRGRFVPYNTLLQAWERGTSDPAYNDFLIANFSLENAYGRAMNPQGLPRVSENAERRARGILSTATSQQAYETQLRRLWLEVQASVRATAQTRRGQGEDPGSEPFPGGAPAPRPAPMPDYDSWRRQYEVK